MIHAAVGNYGVSSTQQQVDEESAGIQQQLQIPGGGCCNHEAEIQFRLVVLLYDSFDPNDTRSIYMTK